MTGLRITESSDSRITEDGSYRVVEGYVAETGEVSLTGSGFLAPTGVEKNYALVSFSSSGTMQSLGGLKSFGVVDLSSEGINSYTGKFTTSGKFEDIQDEYERVTESGDFRITEGGDDRVTELGLVNSVICTLIITPTYTPFNSELYVKYSGNWKIATPNVKYQNEWVTPIRTYRYMNNRWKRIN